MKEFTIWGGPSYVLGYETYESWAQAAEEYRLRHDTGKSSDGTLTPLWGKEIDPDDYVIVLDADNGLTYADVMRDHDGCDDDCLVH